MIDAEQGRAMRDVWEAAKLLAGDRRFAKLLPEVGTNIVRAPAWAKEPSDVIGLSGRIVRAGDEPRLAGFPTPGGSEHVANLVLTAMRHDPMVRAGLNIRFSDDILEACRRLGLCISSFEREGEPEGVKTMRWGAEQAIGRAGRVPDVIFDRGAEGKEAMVRLLGKSATELAELALRIARLLP